MTRMTLAEAEELVDRFVNDERVPHVPGPSGQGHNLGCSDGRSCEALVARAVQRVLEAER